MLMVFLYVYRRASIKMMVEEDMENEETMKVIGRAAENLAV